MICAGWTSDADPHLVSPGIMTTALGPGKLVIASGLTSSQGKRLNWNFGIVRDGETSEGRLEVEIFARVEGKKVTAEKSKPTVVLKYSNLKCMDDEVVLRKGHPTFMQYLRKKLSDTPLVQYLRKELSDMPLVHDGWEQVYKTCVELAAFPGFKADKDDKITIASSLYMTKRIPAATRVLKKMVKELSPSDPDRSQLFFVLTECLIEGSRFGEALDAIDEIQMEAGEARKDYSDEKSATLVALVVKCEVYEPSGSRPPCILGHSSPQRLGNAPHSN